jgi:anti-anti-sigma regulatory factor
MNRWARLASRANRLIGLVLDVLGAMCIDLTELERVDRGGIEALRRCQRAAGHQGGRLAVIRPGDPVVAQVLDRSGVRRDLRLLARRDELAGAAP